MFNLVKITSVGIADADLTDGTAPSSFTTLNTIKDGTFNLDVPEDSVTHEYSEQTQQTYRVRKSPKDISCSMELVTSSLSEVAALTGATYTAGTTGTDPETLEFGSDSVADQYVQVTGENINGETVRVNLHRAFVTWSWTGAMGANQETVGLTAMFNLLQDAATPPMIYSFERDF